WWGGMGGKLQAPNPKETPRSKFQTSISKGIGAHAVRKKLNITPYAVATRNSRYGNRSHSATSCINDPLSSIKCKSSAVVVERDGHFVCSALAWGAGDCEVTADSFKALAHVRQSVAAALNGRRIKTDSVIGDLDLEFCRFGGDFELDFGGFCVFDGVVERFSE